MIVKVLGILDILAAALIFLNNNFANLLPAKILWIVAFYLIIKGIIFLLGADIASIVDIICGSVIILSIFFVLPKLVTLLVVLFLIQKGAFSLLS